MLLDNDNVLILFQVEVLGVSLPWKGIFTNEGPGSRLFEIIDNLPTEHNPFQSALDVNPFGDSALDVNLFGNSALSNEKVSSVAQPDASANLWVDLLTGDLPSESISQPVTGNSVHEEGGFLDFLDEAVTEHLNDETNSKLISSQHRRHSDNGTQQYINCFKLLAGPNMVC